MFLALHRMLNNEFNINYVLNRMLVISFRAACETYMEEFVVFVDDKLKVDVTCPILVKHGCWEADGGYITIFSITCGSVTLHRLQSNSL